MACSRRGDLLSSTYPKIRAGLDCHHREEVERVFQYRVAHF